MIFFKKSYCYTYVYTHKYTNTICPVHIVFIVCI